MGGIFGYAIGIFANARSVTYKLLRLWLIDGRFIDLAGLTTIPVAKYF